MSPSKQLHSPEGIAAPVGNGYTHAITAGGAIYVSGQIGMDPSGTIAEGFDAQARRAFENLLCVVKSRAMPELLFEIEAIAVPD